MTEAKNVFAMTGKLVAAGPNDDRDTVRLLGHIQALADKRLEAQKRKWLKQRVTFTQIKELQLQEEDYWLSILALEILTEELGIFLEDFVLKYQLVLLVDGKRQEALLAALAQLSSFWENPNVPVEEVS